MASQINQQWVFGIDAGLDFGTSVPFPRSGFAISTGEGCASISDSSGALVMYTDGRSVWDAGNTLQASGPGLSGNPSSTQSAIIVPDPGNGQQYYIFTADGVSGTNNHFDGIRINVSTPTWASAPLSSLMTLPSTAGLSPTERVTAVQHANCTDYWVITVLQKNTGLAGNNGPGVFRIFLVNATGITHIADTPMSVNVADVGYLKASPNGQRLALANYQNNNVLLYDFDHALGAVNIGSLVTINVPSVPGTLPHPRAAYGVEFAANSDVLYYSLLGTGSGGTSSTNTGYVFQVDLTVPPVSTQVVSYSNVGAGYAIGALQRGPDSRIYIAKQGESSLGAILNPTVLGPGCTPNMSYIALLSGSTCNLGLPNLLGNPCDCACAEGCEENITSANQTLNARANIKNFTIVANGQSLPTGCTAAFAGVNIAPGFSMMWGDGLSDQFESNDLEVVYIRIHNPFLNLVFRDVTIFNIAITPNQTLPGGGDTVVIVPGVIDCFDSIEPCSYVSRDFALIIDSALVGTYQLSFDYCIGEIAIVAGTNGNAVFDFDVVAS